MSWRYNQRAVTTIDDIPVDTVGYIYRIVNLDTNQYYIGRKNIYSVTGKGKKQIVKESNWLKYQSSNIEVKKWMNVDKEILCFCKSKIDTTYWETYYQMINNVLLDDKALNKNILGRFFRGKITKVI